MDGENDLMLQPNEEAFDRWQMRALMFYVAAKHLRATGQSRMLPPSAFCVFQAIENMLKAVGFFHDPNFHPEKFNHDILKLIGHLEKLGLDVNHIKIPTHWIRWQEFTRYPDKGFFLGNEDIQFLDKIFTDLIELVPFQFSNGLLAHILWDGNYNWEREILQEDNQHVQRLEAAAKRNLRSPSP